MSVWLHPVRVSGASPLNGTHAHTLGLLGAPGNANSGPRDPRQWAQEREAPPFLGPQLLRRTDPGRTGDFSAPPGQAPPAPGCQDQAGLWP